MTDHNNTPDKSLQNGQGKDRYSTSTSLSDTLDIIDKEKYIFSINEVLDYPCDINSSIWKYLSAKSLTGLIGSSDAGKSMLARQLAIEIISGSNTFLGSALRISYPNVIYVSTEDGVGNTKEAISKQIVSRNFSGDLTFIFYSENIIGDIDKQLSKLNCDLVILDSLSDLVNGDLKSETVRPFLHKLHGLCFKFETSILIIHHLSKANDKFISKHSAIGTQSFEAKCRSVIQLTSDHYLACVKANFLPTSEKSKAIKLLFDEDSLTFKSTGNYELIENLQPESNLPTDKFNVDWKAILGEQDKMKYSDIVKALVEQYDMSAPTAKRYIPKYLEKKTDDHGYWGQVPF